MTAPTILSATEREIEKAQLRAIEKEMEKDNAAKHTGAGVYSTAAWLKAKNDNVFRNAAFEDPVEIDIHQVMGYQTSKGHEAVDPEKVKKQLHEIEETPELQVEENAVLKTTSWLKSPPKP